MKSERRDGHECCWFRILLEIVKWQKILAMAYYCDSTKAKTLARNTQESKSHQNLSPVQGRTPTTGVTYKDCSEMSVMNILVCFLKCGRIRVIYLEKISEPFLRQSFTEVHGAETF